METFTQEELIKKFKNIEMLSMDVDGTLTTGGLYLNDDNLETKRFSAHDGAGLIMVKYLGVKLILISTSDSNSLKHRANKLGMDKYIKNSFNKGEAIVNTAKELGVSLSNTIHIGDDVNDIKAFTQVGYPIMVANGVNAVEEFTCYKTSKEGGFGAVREVCDMIIMAKTGRLYSEPFTK